MINLLYVIGRWWHRYILLQNVVGDLYFNKHTHQWCDVVTGEVIIQMRNVQKEV